MITRKELVKFMRSVPLVTAATLSQDGAPQAALLGAATSDQLELVFDTVDNSRKFGNVLRDGRIAVVFGAAGGYVSGSHDERVRYSIRAWRMFPAETNSSECRKRFTSSSFLMGGSV